MNKLSAIVKLANERLKKEIEQYIPKKAIGYLDINDGKNHTKSFIMVNAQPNITISSSFGNTQVNQGIKSHLGGISKNASIVRSILSEEVLNEKRSIQLPNGRVGFINARAEYIPNSNKRILENGYLDVDSNEIFIFHRDMIKEFNEISSNDAQLDILNKEIAKFRPIEKGAEIIVDEVDSNEIEQEKILQQQQLNEKLKQRELLENENEKRKNNLYKYKRSSKTLRQIVSLKGKQDDALVNNLLQGPLIINGGPGTGKTTVLIHKLQFLRDNDPDTNRLIIEDTPEIDIVLSDKDRSLILDQHKGWVFFSPTELLRSYLKDSMAAEGLTANQESVRVWDIHKTSLMKSFDFFNSDNPKFLRSSIKQELLNPNATKLKSIIKEFDAFMIKDITTVIRRTYDLELIKELSWYSEGLEIQSHLEKFIVKPTIETIVRIHNKIKRTSDFITIGKMVDEEYNSVIDKSSKKVFLNLSIQDKDKLINIITERKKKSSNYNEDEVINETHIIALIKSLINSDALYSLDKNTNRVSSNNKVAYEICEQSINLIKDEYYFDIAQFRLFRKYFKPFLLGAERLIIDKLAERYKGFRKEILLRSNLLKVGEQKILKEVISEYPQNKRIHEDEMDLFLFLLMSTIRNLYSISVPTFEKSKNKFVEAYKDHAKAIVAVDEATDFTLTQLACMSQIAHPRFNCIVLVGDTMQKLSGRGIESWDDFIKISPKTKREDLHISYRQTPKLLNLASVLHESHFGIKPNYIAKAKTDGKEPNPLVFRGISGSDKIEWLSNRINELHDIYEGVIPNIAIFAQTDKEVISIAEELNKYTPLYDRKIETEACISKETLGNIENVRVFNIERIKGLEFEAVFFIDVDKYQGKNQKMLDRYVYVGISRASVFLAITLENDFPKSLESIAPFFSEGSWSEGIQEAESIDIYDKDDDYSDEEYEEDTELEYHEEE